MKKLLTCYSTIAFKRAYKPLSLLLCSAVIMNLAACDEMLAWGPGTGGTGPFITGDEEILVAALAPTDGSGSVSSDETDNSSANNNEDDNDDASTGSLIKTTISAAVLEKSADDSICGNFTRSISIFAEKTSTNLKQAMADEPIHSNNRLDVSINTAVTNISNDQQLERRLNCTSYDVLSTFDFINNQTCETPEENLAFLPEQTHNYKLTLKNLAAGTYEVVYKNYPYNDDQSIQCDTYLRFVIE